MLGPVEIVRAGQPVPAGSPRQRALLALLALSVGVAVPPSRLVDLLWGESPPPAAGNTVQVYVSRLRRLLAGPGELPALRTVSGMYLLDLPPEAIDARRFEEASESGRARLAAGDPVGAAHELRSALQLWRGSGLPDLKGVPGAVASVARLQSLRLSTLADRIDAESLLGRHSRLIPELQDLVRKHPLNERFVGQLMTSLYWEGRQAEALAAYAAAAGRLGDELGIDPCPALRELHGRLLRQEVGLVATAFSDDASDGLLKAESESKVSAERLVAPTIRGRRIYPSVEAVRAGGNFGVVWDSDSLGESVAAPDSGAPGGFGDSGSAGPLGAMESSGNLGRAGLSGLGRIPGQRSGEGDGAGQRGGARRVDGGREGDGDCEVDGEHGGRVVEGRAGQGRGARGRDVAGLTSTSIHRQAAQGKRVAPAVFSPGPSGGLFQPHAELPTPPVVPGGVTGFLPQQASPVDLPVPQTMPAGPGPAPSVGAKRTPFGAAFGAGTVGRAGELSSALELLRRPDVRLVTIVGPGGAGKTRLAAQVVARRLAEIGRSSQPEFGQAGMAQARVLVIPLSGTPAGQNSGAEPGAGLAARLRRILGAVPDTPGEAPIDTVCRALAAVPCLLLLDDLDLAESNARETEPLSTVLTLITRVGGLRVLATSRQALGVAGEQVIGLSPLPMPWACSGAGDVQTVRSAEAVRLFRDRARAVLPAFEVTPQNAGAVSELCRALDGLPLALELAAARSRGTAPEQIGEELAALRGQVSPRPGSVLENVLAWTINLLEDTERLVLSQLSIFVGGATLEAAERVCGPVPGPGQVIDVIGRLAEKNLLLIDETGRLGMLSPVREHARRILAEDPAEEAASADRHAAYFAEVADALPPMTDRWIEESESTSSNGIVAHLGGRAAEYDNLAAAAAHAEGLDGEAFARVVVALLDQGMATGRWELGDAPAWLNRAQEQRPTARTGARLLLAGGSLALFGGNPLAAADILARVPAGEPNAIRAALMKAVAARTLGRSEEAQKELEAALERMRLVRHLPDPLWHAVFNTLADVLDDQGRTAQAIGYWQRSRHRAAAGGDSARLAYPLARLALAGQDRGEDALAEVLITQARSAAGSSAAKAAVEVAGALLELRGGDDRKALAALHIALQEAHRAGRFFTLPRIVALLGVAYRHQHPERAAAALATATAWSAQRSIVITGRRERALISEAETALNRAARTSGSIRRSAARGAAVPFGSLIGVLRLAPAETSEKQVKTRLIDLTEAGHHVLN
ncbi:hypothetical protein GCM10027456_12350 [Kineosporia babensis]